MKSVWASIGESIADNIEDVIEDNDGSGILGDSMSEYGQHGASMLALYDYFSEVCGLRSETEVSSGQWNLAQSAGWALAHDTSVGCRSVITFSSATRPAACIR
jgi:hypothetical protein